MMAETSTFPMSHCKLLRQSGKKRQFGIRLEIGWMKFGKLAGVFLSKERVARALPLSS